jgi:hypothetical protein
MFLISPHIFYLILSYLPISPPHQKKKAINILNNFYFYILLLFPIIPHHSPSFPQLPIHVPMSPCPHLSSHLSPPIFPMSPHENILFPTIFSSQISWGQI